ncbi:MAG: class I SAM-dependent methyltransferase [Bdellovibrionales bacterium]
MKIDSTQRFGNRAENYAKYRPDYPAQIVTFMTSELDLNKNSVVADIGSGTGICSELFLKNGNVVYAVEPNDKMRETAEHLLSKYPRFISQKGTAESTGLPDGIADFIVAAQAFHWFDVDAARFEFERILKTGGQVVLIWNDRRASGTPFSEAYERLLTKFGTDYQQVRHRNLDENRIQEVLGEFECQHFLNHQDLNFESLVGRLASTSYVPNSGQPRFDEMLAELSRIFDAYNKNHQVRIEYDTRLYSSKARRKI